MMGRLPLLSFTFVIVVLTSCTLSRAQDLDASDAALAKRIDTSPPLALIKETLQLHTNVPGLTIDSISGVAIGRSGLIYVIQRRPDANAILVFNQKGILVRSWGRGDFTLPHSLRIDRHGNVWAIDAGASKVIEYSAAGTRLTTISIEPVPNTGSPFRGATDLAFSPDGHVFTTDGYGNSRVLEYTEKGTKVREWGSPGTGPGQFHLPHAIQISSAGTVYVADRENGRIELFDLRGTYLRSFEGLGRCYALVLHGGALWVAMGPRNQDPGSPGWIVKMDPESGRILGHLFVPDQRAGHAIDLLRSGEVLETAGSGLLIFRPGHAISHD